MVTFATDSVRIIPKNSHKEPVDTQGLLIAVAGELRTR